MLLVDDYANRPDDPQVYAVMRVAFVDGDKLDPKRVARLLRVWTNKSGAKDLSKWKMLADVIDAAWGDPATPETLKKEWMQAKRGKR